MSAKLTQDTYDMLRAELDELKTVRRAEIAERIREARSFGDLSENSEYDEAKNEQAKVESRIMEIENILSKAEIIKDKKIRTDIVTHGCLVHVYDCNFDEEVDFVIVSSVEADLVNKKISDESPLGLALLGKKVGDIVVINTAQGECKYKILQIGDPNKK